MSVHDDTAQSVQAPGSLARVLTFGDLVAYGVTYLAPIAPWATFGYVYALSGRAVSLAYLVGFLCMCLTANSYRQICGEVSGPGSVYAYARLALGPRAGFLAGWLVLLDYLLLPALMYVLAAVALHTFLPAVPRWVWVFAFTGFAFGVNWIGIAFTARVNAFFMWAQLAVAGVFVLWMLSLSAGGPAPALPLDAIWSPAMTPEGVFAAVSICVLAFLGFDAITTLNEEVRQDQTRLIGRAIMVVLAIVGSIFVIQTWVMAGLAQGRAFDDLASAGYDLASDRISPTAGVFMAWFVALIAGIALTPPMMVGVTRILYAMAGSGQLPAYLKSVHPTRKVPRWALLTASLISAGVALAFMERPDELTSLVNLGALGAYACVHLSVIALFGLRRRTGRWLVHVVMPVIGITVIGAVVAQMNSAALKLGGAWLAAGLFYVLLLARWRPEAIRTPVEPA